MPIATSLVSLALLAAPAVAAGPRPAFQPSMLVSVTIGDGVPASLVTRALDEASLIWRQAGISIVRQLAGGPAQLRIVVGDDPGKTDQESLPLGWIRFDDDHTPEPSVYLSFRNAMMLLHQSAAVVGSAGRMPRMEVEMLLSRAMGRALAHEIGHYLLASKAHSRTGLMQAVLRAVQLFSASRPRLVIDTQQRGIVAARLAAAPPLSSS